MYMQDGRTALNIASSKGHAEVVELLLKKHADVSISQMVYYIDECSSLWASESKAHTERMSVKTISGGARQAKRSLDSTVSSLLTVISREYLLLVYCTTGLYTQVAPEH